MLLVQYTNKRIDLRISIKDTLGRKDSLKAYRPLFKRYLNYLQENPQELSRLVFAGVSSFLTILQIVRLILLVLG
jgi:hypothetical protein